MNRLKGCAMAWVWTLLEDCRVAYTEEEDCPACVIALCGSKPGISRCYSCAFNTPSLDASDRDELAEEEALCAEWGREMLRLLETACEPDNPLA